MGVGTAEADRVDHVAQFVSETQEKRTDSLIKLVPPLPIETFPDSMQLRDIVDETHDPSRTHRNSPSEEFYNFVGSIDYGMEKTIHVRNFVEAIYQAVGALRYASIQNQDGSIFDIPDRNQFTVGDAKRMVKTNLFLNFYSTAGKLTNQAILRKLFV